MRISSERCLSFSQDSMEPKMTMAEVVASFFEFAGARALQFVEAHTDLEQRRVAHEFQRMLNTPQGRALLMLDEWQDTLYDQAAKDCPMDLAVSVFCLMRMLHEDRRLQRITEVIKGLK